MTTPKFTQPDFTTQSPTVYKANIDAAIAVLGSLGAQFIPSEPDVPSRAVRVSAGRYFNRSNGTVYDVPAKTVAIPTGTGTYIVQLSPTGNIFASASISRDNWPIAKVTATTSSGNITESMVMDSRPIATGFTQPSNVFLITSSTTWNAPTCSMLRITAGGGGGGGGGGAANAAGTLSSGGGGGGGAATIVNRLLKPSTLTIVIGAGGSAGNNGVSPGSTGTAGTAGGTTTVTSADWALSCAGGGGGAPGTGATSPVSGAGGTAGAAGTGLAGTAGTAGTSGAIAAVSGGKGGSTANKLSVGTDGAVQDTPAVTAQFGAGGGGGCSYAGEISVGAKGGDGFVLIEVF